MKEIVKYMTDSGAEIELSPQIIRDFLVSGNGNITDQEVMMYLKLCQYQKLNPFLREVYIIKYGDRYPATTVTGKETFLKRAMRNPKYEGHRTGISDDGQQAWAEVYLTGYAVPIRCDVDYDEYVGIKDGKPNKMWASKPKTMLKKVALVQALREAFPEDLGGLYFQEEVMTSELSSKPVQKTMSKSSQTEQEEESIPFEEAEVPLDEGVESMPQNSDDDTVMTKIAKITKQASKPDAPKKWTRYHIHSIGGTEYTTFDKKQMEVAKEAAGANQECLILFKYNAQFKTYAIESIEIIPEAE